MASDGAWGSGLALPMTSYAPRVTEERLSLGKSHQSALEMEESFTTVLLVGGKLWIREEFCIFHSVTEATGCRAIFWFV